MDAVGCGVLRGFYAIIFNDFLLLNFSPPFYTSFAVVSSDCILEVLHSLDSVKLKCWECCPWDHGVFPMKRQFYKLPFSLGTPQGLPYFLGMGTNMKGPVCANPGC